MNILKVKNKDSNKGFTITELLVAFAVLAIIVIALQQMIMSIVKTGISLDPQRNVQQAARTAMDSMVTELRYAGRVHGNPNPFSVAVATLPAIMVANQNDIQFRGIVRDVNGGGIDFYDVFYDSSSAVDPNNWDPNNPDAEIVRFRIVNYRLLREWQENSGGAWSAWRGRNIIRIPEVRFKNLEFGYALRGSTFTVPSVGNVSNPADIPNLLDITHIDISLTTEDIGERERFTINSTVRPRELIEKPF